MSFVLVSTCKNRNEFLLKSLPTWLKLNAPIVLVDWSSQVPLRETLAAHLDRVVIVEVPDKQHYHSSASKNLAVRAAHRMFPDATHVFHLDCDVLIKDSEYFLRRVELSQTRFYRGTFRYPVWSISKLMRYLSRFKRFETLSNVSLFGTFVAPFSLFNDVNGMDERMHGYGVDDVDLYQRFRRVGGAMQSNLRSSALYHQPHAGRMTHYREKSTEESIRKNVELARQRSWGPACPQEHHVCRVNGKTVTL
jgi:predicted glycosyltransferase involved in capsule biosynthesis